MGLSCLGIVRSVRKCRDRNACGSWNQSIQRQLSGVVSIEGPCLLINDPMLRLEAGFQIGPDTMLCIERKRQDVHDEYSIYSLRNQARLDPGTLNYARIKCE